MKEATALEEMKETIRVYDCEQGCAALVQGDESAHEGPGVYVYCTEYPDEGSSYLGTDEAKARAALAEVQAAV
jgi:hypothetical protein